MQLSQEQQKAAFTESKKALCLAGAGSGKSRTLVGRVANLIKNKMVSPYEIMCITFTRLAAKEMTERLEKEIGPAAHKITASTIHGMALKLLQTYGELVGLRPDKITVYGSWEEQFLLKDVAKELGFHTGHAWKKVKKGDVEAAFNLFYTTGQMNPESEKENALMNAFFGRCRENNALTYGSILTTFLRLIRHIWQYLNFRHILVDETQDNDPLQWEIINQLCKYTGASLFAVGDIRQCQPAGTMVLTTKGEVDIEHLDSNIHELKVYSRGDAMVFGGYNRGYSFKKSARIFSGLLYDISTEKFNTECTGNHKWLVKWNNEKRTLEWNVVYLMRRGNRFRVGWCQLFYNSEGEQNIFHLGRRMVIEKADSVWILKVFDNKKEASLWESIIAANYGIPTIMFEPKEQTQYYDQGGIDLVFENTWNMEPKAKKLLNDFGLDILYPFHSKQRNHQKKGGARIFEIETVNMSILPDGFFRVPQQKDTGRYLDWKSIKIDSKLVRNITVYSLDVEKYHTYIADGLCTKNSIFSFRGADPEFLIRNQSLFDLYTLRDNYRSSANIVDAANKLISHNALNMGEPMRAIKEIGPPIYRFTDMDSKKLCEYAQRTNEETLNRSAILARNHWPLKKLSQLLTDAGIKHEYIGKKTGLVRSEEFRRFHAFLKLIVNEFDNFSFLLIKDYLKITNEQYRWIRVEAVERSLSHFQVWQENSKNFVWMIEATYLDMDSTIDWMKDIGFGFDPDEIFTFVYTWIIENPAGTISQYLNWLATFDIQDELKEDSDCLQLLTCHAAKGLEFSTVIAIGLNDGIFPSKQSIKSNSLEDERRLGYVCFTRAKDQLILCSRPVKKDKSERIENEPSRFIREALR